MRIFLLLIILSLPIGAFAQSYDEGLSHHQLGIEGSMLTGAGVTYSFIFDSLVRIKTTLLAYYQNQGNSSSDWTGSVGLEIQRTFITTESTRFYGLIGGYYYSHDYTNPSSNYYDSTGNSYLSTTYTTSEHDFAVGLGVGLEVMIWKHVALNIAGSFQYSGVNYNPSNNSNSRYLGPGIGAGVSYRF